MTDKEAMAMALDALENIIDAVYVNSELEAIAVKHANVVIAALKERLAQETALQSLHDENKRLGLYKDAYAQQEQEPVAWQWLGSAHFRKKLPKNADITAWNPLYTAPPQRTEPLIGCVNHDCALCKEKNT